MSGGFFAKRIFTSLIYRPAGFRMSAEAARYAAALFCHGLVKTKTVSDRTRFFWSCWADSNCRPQSLPRSRTEINNSSAQSGSLCGSRSVCQEKMRLFITVIWICPHQSISRSSLQGSHKPSCSLIALYCPNKRPVVSLVLPAV